MKNNSQKDLYITYVINRRVIYNILILVCIYIFVSCVDTETYRLSVMNFEECKSITIESLEKKKKYVIRNENDRRKVLNLLHRKSVFELCKIPPKIIITIECESRNEKFIICGRYIKDHYGTTFKYDIDVETELYKIVFNE
jgi:hypothetical protein